MANDKASKPSKPTKKYAPTRLEVAKTVTIAVLVTAIIAFIAGMQFANSHNAEIVHAVSEVETATQADTPVKK